MLYLVVFIQLVLNLVVYGSRIDAKIHGASEFDILVILFLIESKVGFLVLANLVFVSFLITGVFVKLIVKLLHKGTPTLLSSVLLTFALLRVMMMMMIMLLFMYFFFDVLHDAWTVDQILKLAQVDVEFYLLKGFYFIHFAYYLHLKRDDFQMYIFKPILRILSEDVFCKRP